MSITARQRKRILYRDRYVCQCQGKYRCEHHDAGTPCLAEPFSALLSPDATDPKLQVDHIKAQADGGSDDDDNLQTLCRRCHVAKTKRDNSWRRLSAKLRDIGFDYNPRRT